MAGAAAALVEKLVGGRFNVRETDVTLTTTQGEILRNDPERVGWFIVNTGAAQAQLGFSTGISAAAAILVPLTGGQLSANVLDDYTLPTFAMYGRVEAGTTTLHIVETRRVSE